MSLNLSGTITANVKGESEEIIIDSSEFRIEESFLHHLGEGDYQYEAIYEYRDDDLDIEISFLATCLDGYVDCEPYRINGNIEIIEDNLSVKDSEDFDINDQINGYDNE